MIVDLQLCCALSNRRRVGSSDAANTFQGMEGCFGAPREQPLPLLSPQRPLAHVYGIEDPLCELLQLVRGILGFLL